MKGSGIKIPLILDFHPMVPKMGLHLCAKQVCELYACELSNLIGRDVSIEVWYRSTAVRLASILRAL